MDELPTLLAAGRDALRACDWDRAAQLFEQVRSRSAAPEALDGLAQARYWQKRYDESLRLGERAHAAYRRREQWGAAAQVAVRLAHVHGLVHGNGAAVSGWLGHARRAADRAGDGVSRGWVVLFDGAMSRDPTVRERRSREAVELGRRFDHAALEFDALAYLGKARVEQGEVGEGMALLDEAVAATAGGLVDDAWAVGEIYCSLFHACEMTVDYVRAEAWLASVDAYVERTRELPIAAICRMHYGGLLTAAGRWDRAEHELTTALDIYTGTYVGTRYEPLVRLAALRVRQGRYEEARRLLDGFEDHPAATVVQAHLELATDQPAVAAARLDRRAPTPPCPPSAAVALALRVWAAVAAGSPEEGEPAAAELERMATATELASLRGFASGARARLVAAGGADPAPHLEAALDAFVEGELVHEAALTRLALARCRVGSAPAVAAADAHAARRELVTMGADRDADAAARLLRELGERPAAGRDRVGALTRRQAEVLALVAEGCSNAEIARRLYISPRTAEHHVSNILATLGLRSRTEAAAHARRHLP